MKSLLELIMNIDDFCKIFLSHLESHMLNNGAMQCRRARSLSISEVMTILIHFHLSHYHHFKAYHWEHVLSHLCDEFTGLVS